MNRPYLLITALAALLSTACGGVTHRGDIPVPRPTGYARIELPDSTFRPHAAGGITLQLNAAVDSVTTVDKENQSWVTASYGALDASLYITVTHLDAGTAAEAIDNRIERLSLNTGGRPTEVISFVTSHGLDARIIVTPRESPVPVQFLVTDHRTLLVSGSAMLEAAATAPPDSVSPVVGMLRRDITHTVVNISL